MVLSTEETRTSPEETSATRRLLDKYSGQWTQKDRSCIRTPSLSRQTKLNPAAIDSPNVAINDCTMNYRGKISPKKSLTVCGARDQILIFLFPNFKKNAIFLEKINDILPIETIDPHQS